MNKLTEWIEKYLGEWSKNITDNKYVRSIHEAYLSILPILIIGSFFFVLATLLQTCSR